MTASDPITPDDFKRLLLEIRDAATRQTSMGAYEAVTRQDSDAHESVSAHLDAIWVTEEGRAVWHAAEIGLAVLLPGYIPKREAIEDIRAILDALDDEDS